MLKMQVLVARESIYAGVDALGITSEYDAAPDLDEYSNSVE